MMSMLVFFKNRFSGSHPKIWSQKSLRDDKQGRCFSSQLEVRLSLPLLLSLIEMPDKVLYFSFIYWIALPVVALQSNKYLVYDPWKLGAWNTSRTINTLTWPDCGRASTLPSTVLKRHWLSCQETSACRSTAKWAFVRVRRTRFKLLFVLKDVCAQMAHLAEIAPYFHLILVELNSQRDLRPVWGGGSLGVFIRED